MASRKIRDFVVKVGEYTDRKSILLSCYVPKDQRESQDQGVQRQSQQRQQSYGEQSGGSYSGGRDMDDDIPFAPEWR